MRQNDCDRIDELADLFNYKPYHNLIYIIL